jgi:hypothetical protein
MKRPDPKLVKKWDKILKKNNLGMSRGLGKIVYTGGEKELDILHNEQGDLKGEKGNWDRVVYNKSKYPKRYK